MVAGSHNVQVVSLDVIESCSRNHLKITNYGTCTVIRYTCYPYVYMLNTGMLVTYIPWYQQQIPPIQQSAGE